ncbi:MAG: hypothetical protein Q7R85_01375 [bacterium]|nr:hypothetical protein [bacterium]
MTRKKPSRADAALALQRDPYLEIVPRLEPRALRALIRELPKPAARYCAGGVAIDVFCAKHLYHPSWVNPSLFRLAIDARGSYYRYGDYPPLDALDRKAAVYLARIRYSDGRGENKIPTEEWLSARFIPWRGTPYGYDDLKLCAHKGRAIDYWVQKKFPRPEGTPSLVSISRVCGIPPYPTRASDKQGETRRVKHAYTALAFTAMNDAFFNAGNRAAQEFSHVTTLMHDALVGRALTYTKGKKRAAMRFVPAHRTLGLRAPVRLARDGFAASYCHRFPQYFLDIKKLLGALRGVVRRGDISHATLAHYLGETADPEALLRFDDMHISALHGLGKLLSAEGPLHAAKISGEELRRRVSRVPDGPALHMMTSVAWSASVAMFCRDAGIAKL